VDEDFLMQLEGRHYEQAQLVRLPVYLNTAAVQLKLEDYNAAIWNCGQVGGKGFLRAVGCKVPAAGPTTAC
jgi:hypothetical protein